MPLLCSVNQVLCERHGVVVGTDNTLEDVGVAARGFRSLRSSEIEENGRVVTLNEEHELLTRACERGVYKLAREQLREGWVKAWRDMYSYASIKKRWDFGLDRSWIQNLAYWPINLMMHELAERKIAGGDREWRKHRALDVPFGL